MDLQSLEIRQLHFVKVFTQVDAESTLIKAFLSSFFEAGNDGVDLSDPVLSTFFQLRPLPPADDPPAGNPNPLLFSSGGDDAPGVLPTVTKDDQPPLESPPLPSSIPPPSSGPSRTTTRWSLFPSKKSSSVNPHSSLPRFSISPSAAWDAALAIDQSSRSVLVEEMSRRQLFSDAELAAFKKASDLKIVFDFAGLMSKVLTFPQSVRAMGLCRAFHNTSEGDVYGQAEGLVSGICAEVAAFYFDIESQHNRTQMLLLNRFDEQDTKRAVHVSRILARPNAHSLVGLRREPPPPGVPIDAREYVTLVVWRRLSPTKVAISYTDTEHDGVPRSSDYVRATNVQYIEFTEVSPGKTRVQLFYHTNLNGTLPPALTMLFVPIHKNAAIHEIVSYFQHLLPLSKMTKLEGRNLGDELMERVTLAQKKAAKKFKVEALSEELTTFIGRNTTLRELVNLYPAIKSMLKAVLEQRKAPPGAVKTRLSNMTNAEAARIGSFLAYEIFIGTSSDAAVDTWISTQPALNELAEKYCWFRPFMYALALRIIKTSDWGMKARVILGAGLSMFDMTSDIYMIYTFFVTGQTGYAQANLAMIVTNMLFQVALVLASTSKMRLSSKVREIAFVLLCIKPGVDAYRLATDWESDEQETFDNLQEMTLSKSIETFAESVPAAVSQAFALYKAKTKSSVAAASIILSIATASFSVSVLAFDYDVSPKKRQVYPDLCGFVKSDSRMTTLVILFFMSFFHILMKVATFVLAAAANPLVIAFYLAIDMAIFFCYKLFRRDLIYVPLPRSSAVYVFASIVQRLGAKLVVDFSGCLQQRHPFELTPAYWLSAVALTPLAAIGAAQYYNESDVVDGERLRPDMVWFVVGGLICTWCACWAKFLLIIDRRFLRTFYMSTTASQYLISWFRAAETDEIKSLIFRKGFHSWRSIEGDVRDWVHKNFASWEREKPEWWTKKLIQKIPEQVLSKEQMATLLSKGTKRRRSSLLQEAGLVD